MIFNYIFVKQPYFIVFDYATSSVSQGACFVLASLPFSASTTQRRLSGWRVWCQKETLGSAAPTEDIQVELLSYIMTTFTDSLLQNRVILEFSSKLDFISCSLIQYDVSTCTGKYFISAGVHTKRLWSCNLLEFYLQAPFRWLQKKCWKQLSAGL